MRGHLRRRGKSSWSVVVPLGRDAQGRWKQKWHTVYGTKRQAEAKLTELLSRPHEQTTQSNDATVGAFLRAWLSDVAPMRASQTTLSRYGDIVNRVLTPKLGEIVLRCLTQGDVQSAYSDWQHSAKNPKGVGSQTLTHYHRVFSLALKHAVRTGLIAKNPLDAVVPPRVQKFEPLIIDESTAQSILASIRGNRAFMPVLLAIATGLRRGEALALRWSDVDMKRGIVKVQRSAEEVNRQIHFKAPKSSSGRRSIPLPAFAIPALQEHCNEQGQLRKTIGDEYRDYDLVCCLPDGSPILPSNFTTGFADALKARKLPPIRFHDLRHSHASWLLKAGVNVKAVSERLGHASAAFTLDRYGHVMPGLQDEAARKLDAAFAVSRH